MKLKSVVPAAIFLVTSAWGSVILPAQQAQAQDNDSVENNQAGAVSYQCYDINGDVAFTTPDPKETYGWALGCRRLGYLSNDPPDSQINYYQCYDDNGDVAFTTTNREADCSRVGYGRNNPIDTSAIYYECYNSKGDLAFTTRDPQDTFGWLPSCREIQYRGTAAAQVAASSYACYDLNGSIVFTTPNPQPYQRRGFRCKEL